LTAKFITLVAALAKNNAIGLNGKMPWRLPDELRHFKRITMGKPVIMGRKTRQAIGITLPGRQNVVISRDPQFQADGCDIAQSIEQAFSIATGPELMVIGGGEIYRQAMPHASRMFLTVVDCEPVADTWFPEWNEDEWLLAGSVCHQADESHEYAFELQEWILK